MGKNIKYLIIPDVHGRQFWTEPVKEVLENSDCQIVFLGDYLDPYHHEWEEGVDYRRIAIDRFKEIIQLKKDHPDRITLLLGNHDCGYCMGDDVCSSRMDRRNKKEITGLFEENKKLFQLAKEAEIGGRKVIFSHSGIFRQWAKNVWGEEAEKDGFNVVDRLNNAWLTDDYKILSWLGEYDDYRGWGGVRYASPVWADIRSWYGTNDEDTYGYNIVGHTMVKSPVLFNNIACIDCQRAFYLDSEGIIRDYENDEAYDTLTVVGNE